MAAFNSAAEAHPGDEAACFAIAGAAVKTKYEKRGDVWMTKGNPFEFGADVQKAWVDKRDGEEVLLFEGLASTPSVDKQKEAMGAGAITKMAAEAAVDIFNSHAPKAGEEIGVTLQHTVTPEGGFLVKGELFGDVQAARTIHQRMLTGKQYGLSVGGRAKAAHYELVKGERVRVIDDMELDHICVTPPGRAINSDTWVSAVAKSMDGEDIPDAEGTLELDARHKMIADLQAEIAWAEANVEKAGARHSRKDIEALHGAMLAMQRTCGCEACSAAIQALEAASAETAKAEPREEAIMAEEIKQQETVTEAVPEAVAVTDPEPVAKDEEGVVEAAPPVDLAGIITAAISEGFAQIVAALAAPAAKAEEPEAEAAPEPDADAARIDELSKQIAAQSEQLAKAQAELETLKSAPAAGGPEGKPSGEDRTTVAKGEEPAAPRPLHEVLAAAGDTHGANEAIALQLLHRTAIAVGPPSE